MSGGGWSAPEDCVKWLYVVEEGRWERGRTTLRRQHAPFAQGGMRLSYRAQELERDGGATPVVCKVFKPDCNSPPDDYFNEALTQMVAESYAQDFNKQNGAASAGNVAFLPVTVLEFRNPRPGSYAICTMEPELTGAYVKHNDNTGIIETAEELPQAFSHFSYEASFHQLVVCDIQGVGSYYTDPQVHSFDGNGFGMGNLGPEGIANWRRTHRCNGLCARLRLPTLHGAVETDEQMARRLHEEELAATRQGGTRWTPARFTQALTSAATQYRTQRS